MDITQLTSLTNNLSDEQKLVFSEIYDANKKSTFTAYVLLICFGAVGAHKFYLNNSKGWLYLLFFGLAYLDLLHLLNYLPRKNK